MAALLGQRVVVLIDLDGDNAVAHADAIAVHVRSDEANGKPRIFVGSYVIGLHKVDPGWRISRFMYQVKIVDGNSTSPRSARP